LLCATDGHAKNFSIFIGQGGTYRMTPLYDVLSAYRSSATAQPGFGAQSQARDGSEEQDAHWRIQEIRRRIGRLSRNGTTER